MTFNNIIEMSLRKVVSHMHCSPNPCLVGLNCLHLIIV